MTNLTPFSEFIDVIKNIPPKKMAKLIESHKRFGALKSLCEAKGYIEIMPRFEGIKVLKKTKEVVELKKVIDILQPGKFKWVDKTKKIKSKSKKPVE